MQYLDGRLVYSATDLNNFLECRRLTELESLVARDLLVRPTDDDEQTQLVRRKGDEHERRYLERLRQTQSDLVEFGRPARTRAALHAADAATLEAMRSGASVIYQATFFDGTFVGYADFLRRVETPSQLGSWSYEVADTKLALDSKPYFLIQLANYGEHLERLEGIAPRHGTIILGDGLEQSFLMHDYAAYYRRLKARFLEFARDAASIDDASVYPLPRKHCSYCAWSGGCEVRRVADDHLSLVAWMRRDQIARFEAANIETVAELAAATDAMRPFGMNPQTFVKLRRQAALQVRARDGGRYYELLDHDERTGFGLLPDPDDGDLFFDMEGDPLYEPGRSLEYLFGVWMHGEPNFIGFWGLDRDEEKSAFEAFIDFVMERRKRFPKMHVYHYASYEKTALRRLAQEHSTREDEVDDLLRSETLVDLFAVVRQAIAISENSYSIKRFEKFYDLRRSTNVKKGDASIVMFEQWLRDRDDAVLRDIEAYNRDDCRSTLLLRDWLLERRDEARTLYGKAYPSKQPKAEKEPAPRDEELDAGLDALATRLLHDLPIVDELNFAQLSDYDRARYLLGHALSYHRREDKPVWWAFFDRQENVDDLLEFDREAIAGLVFDASIPPRSEKRSTIFSYRIPEQRYKLGAGDGVYDPLTGEAVGTIVKVDDTQGILELKTTRDAERASAISALIPGGPLRANEQRKSILRIATAFDDGTLQAEYPVVRDLLTGAPPRIAGFESGATIQPREITARNVSAVVGALNSSYLFIQGPPGTGKTTISAEVMCDLLQSGKRIGVVSTGHKAIHHLLHKVERRMSERGATFRGLYKHSATSAHSLYVSPLQSPMIVSTASNTPFGTVDFDLAGGTAWLFSRSDLCGVFDYLFIDEAGQVSLADALAIAGCAKNVVLLGDPSQLAHVSQGSHPYRAAWSVLEHLLGDDPTISAQRGIFLDRSYRMHPQICDFISTTMYDGRLLAAPQTIRHAVESAGLHGSGLRFLPVDHAGNSASSVEEAQRIVHEIAALREGRVSDDAGISRRMKDSDIIVVTPYNAQRRVLERYLADAGFGVPVGTVDRFQGQEAAVVFYSMATSSGDDVPRDLEFLFERNRFNVAISRARALAVLVCNPRLLEVACTSPEQMAMINLLCAYVEKSTFPDRPGVSAARSADAASLSG
ncbi:MAG TPA: TM0106 family RecB-like putative nuclease [Candidatus Aquilonibacter sp.]|nr:TM0106 family RecB-like putative nuclease [Candidatus Aquilonibacter sp.]